MNEASKQWCYQPLLPQKAFDEVKEKVLNRPVGKLSDLLSSLNHDEILERVLLLENDIERLKTEKKRLIFVVQEAIRRAPNALGTVIDQCLYDGPGGCFIPCDLAIHHEGPCHSVLRRK